MDVLAEGAVDQGQEPSIMVHGVKTQSKCTVLPVCTIGGNTGLFTSLQTVPHSQTHQCLPVLIQYMVVQWSSIHMQSINHISICQQCMWDMSYLGFYVANLDLNIITCILLWIQLDSMK